MDTAEKNKIIADFNGEAIEYELSDPLFNLTYNFHKSWDRLMPVVEKIENITNQLFEDVKYKQYHSVRLRFKTSWWGAGRVVGFNEDKKLAYYEAVVEFIKWYNENKKG